MWQRFQTIFLALVAILMIVSLFFPIWRYIDESGTRYDLYPIHYSITTVSDAGGEQKSTAYFPYSLTAILMVAAATVAVQTIRRYDNRQTQILLTFLNTFLLAAVMGSAFYFSYKLNNEFKYVGLSRVSMWIMFAGVAFNWIAMRFIRRDEKIVRDSERLR
jgi:hypothetical protein